MMRRLIAVCWVVALCGCARAPDAPNTLRLRLDADPSTLDPARIVDVSGGEIAGKIFAGLVRVGETGEPVPELAATVAVSDDGLVYTFVLKDEARFSNGRPLTSADVRYSFERLLSPKTASPRRWVLGRIDGADDYAQGKAGSVQGIETPDENTVLLKLEKPFGPFLSLLTMPNAAIVPQEVVEAWGEDFGSHPVGAGPFLLESWQRDVRLVLRRNPHYSDGPKLDCMEYEIIPEDFAASSEFETGNLDILQLSPADIPRYNASSRLRSLVTSHVGLNTYYLGFICDRAPFDDVRLRHAVSHAIDRQKIIDSVLAGSAVVADGPVPPTILPAADERQAPGYDPKVAIRLIAEAGGAPETIGLYLSSGREELSVCEAIQEYLRKVGLDVELHMLEWSSFKDAVSRGEPDIFYLSWWADYPDPENFLFPTFHSSNWGSAGNRSRFASPEVDAAIETAVAETDAATRADGYAQVEKLVVEAAPWVFLWHRKQFVAVQPRVVGFRFFPIRSADRGVQLSLREG